MKEGRMEKSGLGIMLLWAVSRGFFCLQAYLALNELNRNSNLEYKLGEQLPDEEQDRYFYRGGGGIYIWQDKGKVCGITLRLKPHGE